MSANAQKIGSLLSRKLRGCTERTPWGWAFESDELFRETEASQKRLGPFRELLLNAMNEVDVWHVWHVWNAFCRFDHDGNITAFYSGDPRKQLFVPVSRGVCQTLPRFFTWIVPSLLCASSAPRDARDVRLMRDAMGVRVVVTLTEESPLPSSWFECSAADNSRDGVCNVFVPVKNGGAPTFEQVDEFLAMIFSTKQKADDSSAVCIHCGGGKGRTGVFVACFLALFDRRMSPSIEIRQMQPVMTAVDAIEMSRKLRPGSLETSEQEGFVHAYVERQWKMWTEAIEVASSPSRPIDEDDKEGEEQRNVVEITGENRLAALLSVCNGAKRKGGTLLLVMCGLPGSGKSQFCRRLKEEAAKREDTVDVAVFCQDELGSKTALRDAVQQYQSQMSRHRNGPRLRMLVLDKCNVTREARREAVEMFSGGSVSNGKLFVACVWFDVSPEICAASANARTSHPTLRPGKAERVVRAMDSTFEAPDPKKEAEAEMHCVFRVRRQTKAALDELMRRIFVSPISHISYSTEERDGRKAEERRAQQQRVLTRFPRTKHLVNLGAASSDDHTCSPREMEAFLDAGDDNIANVKFVVQEKVDGANLGLSIDPESLRVCARNRSHFVTSQHHAQFRGLDVWIEKMMPSIWYVLTEDGKVPPGRRVLYGEWLAVRHSVPYTNLPDVFLAFDMYDEETGAFVSMDLLNSLLDKTDIRSVPVLRKYDGCQFDKQHRRSMSAETFLRELVDLAENALSSFQEGGGNQRVEGVYVRRERGDLLEDRAKIVRSGFIRPEDAERHWSKGRLVYNTVSPSTHRSCDSQPQSATDTLYADVATTSDPFRHPKHPIHPSGSNRYVSFRQGFACCKGRHVEDIALGALRMKSNSNTDVDVDVKHPFHVTLVDKNEFRTLDDMKRRFFLSWIDEYNKEGETSSDPWIVLGAAFNRGKAGASGFSFAALLWPKGDEIRDRLGLPPKDFHVTLSHDVDHEMASRPGALYKVVVDAARKEGGGQSPSSFSSSAGVIDEVVGSYIRRQSPLRTALLPLLRNGFASRPMKEVTFYALSEQQQEQRDDEQDRHEFVRRVATVKPNWATAWMRIGDALVEEEEFEGAKIAYAVALCRILNTPTTISS